jgi:hypothetical protein
MRPIDAVDVTKVFALIGLSAPTLISENFPSGSALASWTPDIVAPLGPNAFMTIRHGRYDLTMHLGVTLWVIEGVTPRMVHSFDVTRGGEPSGSSQALSVLSVCPLDDDRVLLFVSAYDRGLGSSLGRSVAAIVVSRAGDTLTPGPWCDLLTPESRDAGQGGVNNIAYADVPGSVTTPQTRGWGASDDGGTTDLVAPGTVLVTLGINYYDSGGGGGVYIASRLLNVSGDTISVPQRWALTYPAEWLAYNAPNNAWRTPCASALIGAGKAAVLTYDYDNLLQIALFDATTNPPTAAGVIDLRAVPRWGFFRMVPADPGQVQVTVYDWGPSGTPSAATFVVDTSGSSARKPLSPTTSPPTTYGE